VSFVSATPLRSRPQPLLITLNGGRPEDSSDRPALGSSAARRYGGTEAVVHLLCEELVRQGQDVTLCASGDSSTSAQLRAFYPRSLRTADGISDKNFCSWHHAVLSMREARGFDIVHNHAGEQVMALHDLLPNVPMLTTMHCLITPDTQAIWDGYSGYHNSISWSQRRFMPKTGGTFAGVVYNAIDVQSFPFQEKKGDYLLFLSRISPEKGPHRGRSRAPYRASSSSPARSIRPTPTSSRTQSRLSLMAHTFAS
jgi:glycosyltransferase involved in cell wall biosynthesis